MQMAIHYDLDTRDGNTMRDTVYQTVNCVPRGVKVR
jgi:hypothetical protein